LPRTSADPLGAALVPLRRVGDVPRVREQDVDVLDAVLEGVVLHGLLQGAALDGVLGDGLHRVVREGVAGLAAALAVLLEHVASAHLVRVLVLVGDDLLRSGGIGLRVVAVAGRCCALQSGTDHVVDDGLLVLVHGLVDLLNRGVVVRGHLLLGLGVSHLGCLRLFLLGRRSVGVLQLETGVDDRLIHVNIDLAVAVRDSDVVDQSARIGARQDQRQLANDAVRNLLGLLDQTVGEDGQRGDISVLHQRLRVLTLGRLVEEAVGVHALISVLENGVAQDVLRRCMPVLPNERDSLRVLVLEGARKNRAPIRAPETELRGPATEVRLHGVGRVHQAVLRRRVTEVQSGMLSHFDCSFRNFGSSALLERS
jgi:hypothetical protein